MVKTSRNNAAQEIKPAASGRDLIHKLPPELNYQVMRRFWALFLSVPLFAATVPGRYIVQLSIEPVAVHASRSTAQGNVHATAA